MGVLLHSDNERPLQDSLWLRETLQAFRQHVRDPEQRRQEGEAQLRSLEQERQEKRRLEQER